MDAVIFSRRKPAVPPLAPELARVDERALLERRLLELAPQVRRWLFRMLGPSHALDDATQDALIALAEALPTLADGAKLQAFARTVTTRVGYRYFSRKQPPLREPDEVASPEPAQYVVLAEQQGLTRLYRCLHKLPAKRRMAFVLCGIEGMSHAEAALLERTSEASMRARYMHARRELTRMLGGDQESHHD